MWACCGPHHAWPMMAPHWLCQGPTWPKSACLSSVGECLNPKPQCQVNTPLAVDLLFVLISFCAPWEDTSLQEHASAIALLQLVSAVVNVCLGLGLQHDHSRDQLIARGVLSPTDPPLKAYESQGGASSQQCTDDSSRQCVSSAMEGRRRT